MNSWIISIVGITVFSILLDLFLPEGKMQSYIKTIFNYIIVLVVITPIPKLINKDISSQIVLPNDNDILLQEDYIYQINRDKLTYLEKEIENKLEKEKLLNIDISLNADIFVINMKIESIYVDLSNLVIEKEDKHINIKNEVVKVITSFVKIEEKDIIFNE